VRPIGFRLLQIAWYDGYRRMHGLVECDDGSSVQIAPYWVYGELQYIARAFSADCKHVGSAHSGTMWGALAAVRAVA